MKKRTQIERRITQTYRWWTEHKNAGMLLEKYDEELSSSAVERMSEMTAQGYTSGELIAEINGISFSGWWEITTETIS